MTTRLTDVSKPQHVIDRLSKCKVVIYLVPPQIIKYIFFHICVFWISSSLKQDQILLMTIGWSFSYSYGSITIIEAKCVSAIATIFKFTNSLKIQVEYFMMTFLMMKVSPKKIAIHRNNFISLYFYCADILLRQDEAYSLHIVSKNYRISGFSK